jgi:phage terminase large subunit-like protein
MAQKITKINLDDLHPGQLQVSNERRRFNVLSCGRRWGKTHMTNYLIAEMVQYNMSRGLGEDMGYMSPTYKNLAPTWRNFVRTFKPIITYKSETDHIAEILHSFYIEFWSLDKPETIRGRKYKRIIVDEAALIHALRIIFKLILLPTVGDLVGDVWFFSTPRGFNDFYHFYQLGQNPLFQHEWMSWIKPTSSNPYFPKDELETQRTLIEPAEFAQEWEGKFVAVGNSPFDVRDFKRAAIFEDAVGEGNGILHNIRYWDIANSKDGDYTASSKLSVSNEPRFIISNPVRWKGLWGSNYPYIKATMLAEPEVIHIIETEGVGGIAYQMMKMDEDLRSITIMPAGKVFTMQTKQERANLWAMELRNGRMTIIEQGNYRDVLEEIMVFPAGDHDDYVDGISGNFLGFVYFCGGYKKLLDSKKVHQKEEMGTGHSMRAYQKESLIDSLEDEFS